MADSHVVVSGNLTRDPELRFTPSGTAVCSLSLAVNHRFQRNNEWEEEVSFFDVVAWQQLGENTAQTFVKGQRVTVRGRLSQRSWETQDGDKRSKVEIVADDVAASLKYATADITKVERGGPSQARAAVAAPSGYDPEEEPF